MYSLKLITFLAADNLDNYRYSFNEYFEFALIEMNIQCL